jgi:5-methylcytosine-specific restriction enzyme A
MPASAEEEARRTEAHRFYCGRPWIKVRAMVLARQPLCVDCQALGRVVVAREVHHVAARREHPELAYDLDNLVGLCTMHHMKRRKGERR